MDERLLRHDVIVFDVGNVLVEFDPKRIAAGFGFSDALYRGVFESGLWFWMDTGLLTVGKLARMMCDAAHTDSLEDYLQVCELLEHFDRYERLYSGSLLLPELKRVGKKLYYLTNYGTPMFERTMKHFPIFDYFDGGVVSGRENILKPMPSCCASATASGPRTRCLSTTTPITSQRPQSWALMYGSLKAKPLKI